MKTSVDAATLKEWIKAGRKIRIVDIRAPEQHGASRIPGSENAYISAAIKQGDADAVNRIVGEAGVPIVTVCNQGGSCRLAADLLRERGVEAYSLEGGMQAWLESQAGP